MQITVLGCGALGQLWLTALYKQGHELQGWLRVPQPYCHVNLLDRSGDIFNRSFIANDPQFLAESDLLLVTLKAWQVSDAVKALAQKLPETTPILLLHNGIGTLEELGRLQHPILQGFTTQAAKRDGNVIVHVANGVTHIGPGNFQAAGYSYLADILHQALPDVAWHNNIDSASWNKLAVNCVINPLTALYNCRNGDLAARNEEVFDICDEIAHVMEREGYNISTENLFLHVKQVIECTADNISSMLQDVREQRHTEIDYITGYLIRRARANGTPVPLNTRLYEQVKRKEDEYERSSAGLPGSWS